jgi:hypothetical protein
MKKKNEIPCIKCILLAICKSKQIKPTVRIVSCNTLLTFFDSLPKIDTKERENTFEIISDLFS